MLQNNCDCKLQIYISSATSSMLPYCNLGTNYSRNKIGKLLSSFNACSGPSSGSCCGCNLLNFLTGSLLLMSGAK